MTRTLQHELNRRITYLQGLSFDDAPSRFKGFLDWLESEPASLRILTSLRQRTDLDKITEGSGPQKPPKPTTPEDVARLGLLFFEASKEDGNQVVQLLFGLGCLTPHGDIDSYFILALEKYINPFLGYLQEEISLVPQQVSLDAVATFRKDEILNPNFAVSFPQTAQLLSNLGKEMGLFTESENWFNIANSCREAMKSFAAELAQLLSIAVPADLKAGDFKGILRHILSTKIPDGRSRDALEKLVVAAWDYVQCLLHRTSTSRQEAMRAYLWVGLVLSEVFEQTNATSGPGESVAEAQIPA